MLYNHFDAPPLVARCAFHLNLLHQLFHNEVCLQLCGTPYGLFTNGTMAGSWVLLHLANTRFAERVPAVRLYSKVPSTLKKPEPLTENCN